MNIATFHSIWTVILFVCFVCIIIWAFSNRQKPRFQDAANLVFADDDINVSTKKDQRSKPL